MADRRPLCPSACSHGSHLAAMPQQQHLKNMAGCRCFDGAASRVRKYEYAFSYGRVRKRGRPRPHSHQHA